MAIITGPEGEDNSDNENNNGQDNQSDQSGGEGNGGEENNEEENEDEENFDIDNEESIKELIDIKFQEIVDSFSPAHANYSNNSEDLMQRFQDILGISYRVNNYRSFVNQTNENAIVQEIEMDQEAAQDKIEFIVNQTNFINICLTFLTRNENENQILDEQGNPIIVDEGQQYKVVLYSIEMNLFGILWNCSFNSSAATSLIGNEKFVLFLLKRVIQGTRIMDVTYQNLLQKVASNTPVGVPQHIFVVVMQMVEACLRVLQNAVCDEDDTMKLINDYGIYFVDRYLTNATRIYTDIGYPILSQVGKDVLGDFHEVLMSQGEVLAQMVRNVSCIPSGGVALLKIPKVREFVVKFSFLREIGTTNSDSNNIPQQNSQDEEDAMTPIRVACLSTLTNFSDNEDEKPKLLADFPSLPKNLTKLLLTTTPEAYHEEEEETASERVLSLATMAYLSLNEVNGAILLKEEGLFAYLLHALEHDEKAEKHEILQVIESLIYASPKDALQLGPNLTQAIIRAYKSTKDTDMRESCLKALSNLALTEYDKNDPSRFPRFCEYPELLTFMMSIIKNTKTKTDIRRLAATVLISTLFSESEGNIRECKVLNLSKSTSMDTQASASATDASASENEVELKDVDNIQYIWNSNHGFINFLFTSILHEEDEAVKIELLGLLRGLVWCTEIAQSLMPTEMMGKVLLSITKGTDNPLIVRELVFTIHNAATHMQNTNLETLFPPIIQMMINLIATMQKKPKSKKKSRKAKMNAEYYKQCKIGAYMSIINILREKGISKHEFASKNLDLKTVTSEIFDQFEIVLKELENIKKEEEKKKQGSSSTSVSSSLSVETSTQSSEASLSNENSVAGKSLESNTSSKSDIHPRAGDKDEEAYLAKKLKEDVSISENENVEKELEETQESNEKETLTDDDEVDPNYDAFITIDFLITIHTLVISAPNDEAKQQIASRLILLTDLIMRDIKSLSDKESKDIFDIPDMKLFLLSLSSLCNGPSDPIVKQMQSDLQFVESVKQVCADKSDEWLLSTYPILYAVLNSSS